MKLTALQIEVLENLESVVSDGSRHEPQFRLGERNVTRQVTSLRNSGCIELHDGRLTRVTMAPQQAKYDDAAAVNAMRDFLTTARVKAL